MPRYNKVFLCRDQKSLIEKDVNRTDRKRAFYEGNENISLKLLNDVLVTYVMYNFDLGKENLRVDDIQASFF